MSENMLPNYQTKIKKIKILSHEFPKGSFKLPKSNNYFTKLQINDPLKDTSANTSKDVINDNSIILKRSISLNNSVQHDKMPSSSTSIPLEVISLPKIKTYRPTSFALNDKIIYRSELRSFRYEQIVEKERQLQQKDNLLKLLEINALKKMYSYGSQDQLLDQPIQLPKTEKEQPYEEYDRYLMQKEPVLYKQRHFKLKHKVQWVYTK